MSATGNFETCESCAAPLDHNQRYCVVCGAHRRHVRDPAARYLAEATSRQRARAARVAAVPRRARRASASFGTAVAVAALPLAIGLGVIIGRSSNNGDAKLIAALRAQQPQVVAGPAATSATAASSGPAASTRPVDTLQSSFPYPKGYAVELQTLAAAGTTRATVDAAEAAARAKGAPAPGLIVPTQFTVSPAAPHGAYVLYAGAARDQAAAARTLSGLRAKFPHAVLIKVTSTAAASTAGAGRVLTQTKYGAAHQIAGSRVTQAQLQQGGQVVQKIQKVVGKSYVDSQRGLPDQISVP